jgi:hypothetical protein
LLCSIPRGIRTSDIRQTRFDQRRRRAGRLSFRARPTCPGTGGLQNAPGPTRAPSQDGLQPDTPSPQLNESRSCRRVSFRLQGFHPTPMAAPSSLAHNSIQTNGVRRWVPASATT